MAGKRITKHTIREHAKKDRSPNWDGADTWTADQFAQRYREATQFYNTEYSGRDLKPKVIEWMNHNGFDKQTVKLFKQTKDWRCNITMGTIACCLLKGMPASRADFNNGRDSAEWLRESISEAIEAGTADEIPVEEVKKTKVDIPQVTIQDRVREQAGAISEDLDYAIDNWIKDPETFNPKEFKIVNMLRGKGCKAAHARYIKTFFERGQNELLELASGKADEQLREAYSHRPRRHIKKLIEFYELLMSACDQIAAEAKVLKKPRAKKVKPAEELVKKLKFRVSDDKLSVTSVPPAQIIGGQGLVVYNIKNRKIGYYISKSSEGFGVKGTGLTNYSEKSYQKTLRKPPEQLKEFKDQNTQKRFEMWFAKNVKTTETALNGRFNQDIILLKVFK